MLFKSIMILIYLEMYQLKAGTIFDNILITDSENQADEVKKETFDLISILEIDYLEGRKSDL